LILQSFTRSPPLFFGLLQHNPFFSVKGYSVVEIPQ
jgi:hypothetical protein